MHMYNHDCDYYGSIALDINGSLVVIKIMSVMHIHGIQEPASYMAPYITFCV